MTREVHVKRATPSDLVQIDEFIARTYGATARFKRGARWQWQFVDNPFRPAGDSSDPTVWIAVADDRVIGQIAVQDGCFYLGETARSAGWIVDVMIEREFRGMGLGHRIHSAVMAERDVLVTLTMASATRRIAEKAGCITLGETRQYIAANTLSNTTIRRFLNARATGKRIAPLVRMFGSSWIGPNAVSLGLRVAGSSARAFGPRNVDSSAQIEEIERFGPEFDELWNGAGWGHAPAFERSARFLNWRFCDAPTLVYRRFALRDRGVLQGYVVTRIGDPAELPLGVVADVFARDGNRVVLDTLLEKAREVLAGCEFIEAAASRPDYQNAFRRAGFLGTRRMRPTIVCTDPQTRELLARYLEDWHFTKADHDWDQVHPAEP